MSFLEKARQAASQAADQARTAADQARTAADQARQKAVDPATHEKAREAVAQAGTSAREAAGLARKSLGTMVERIDPGLLADVVVKATALQERSNLALRERSSPYRISEVVITAALPPQVSFTIARIGEADEAVTGREITSQQLLAAGEDGERPVVSLDPTLEDAIEADEFGTDEPAAEHATS